MTVANPNTIEVRGRTVRHATGGADPAGPAVVLVHGAGGDRTLWQLQTRWLAHNGYRPHALDLPGHGGSEGPALETIAELGEWLIEVLDALELDSAHLVGHSMGTYVAIETAARRPSRVRSLVLVATAAHMDVHPDLLAASLADESLAARLVTSWGLAPRARVGGQTAPGTWLAGANRALIERAAAGALHADLRACAAYGDAVERISALECPVAFVLGAADKMTPVTRARPLIEACSRATVVTVDQVGHFAMFEDPQRTRQALADALEAAESSTKDAAPLA